MYYHLGAYEDSLTYALGAGDLFDVNGHSEYVETIIGMIIYGKIKYAANLYYSVYKNLSLNKLYLSSLS